MMRGLSSPPTRPAYWVNGIHLLLFWDIINFKDARSFAWREKLYSHGFSDCLVHFICGHEDDYFTRYNKATLVRDHCHSGSGNIVRNVCNYVEVGIAKREVERLQFSSRAFNLLCYVGAAPQNALACKTRESI